MSKHKKTIAIVLVSVVALLISMRWILPVGIDRSLIYIKTSLLLIAFYVFAFVLDVYMSRFFNNAFYAFSISIIGFLSLALSIYLYSNSLDNYTFLYPPEDVETQISSRYRVVKGNIRTDLLKLFEEEYFRNHAKILEAYGGQASIVYDQDSLAINMRKIGNTFTFLILSVFYVILISINFVWEKTTFKKTEFLNQPQITTIDIQLLQKKITNGEISFVLDFLIKHSEADGFFKNKIIQIKSRHNKLKSNNQLGIISYDEEKLELNRITMAILEIINSIQTNE